MRTDRDRQAAVGISDGGSRQQRLAPPFVESSRERERRRWRRRSRSRWARSSSTSTRRPRLAVGAIAGRPHSRSLPTSAPARLRPTLNAARAKRVATVVLDTPPRSETAALEAARAADLVIVPCRPQIVDLETVPTTIQVLALARDPLAVAVLVAVPPRGQRADQARRAIQGLSLRVRIPSATGPLGETPAPSV